MSKQFNLNVIATLLEKLNGHPVYAALRDLEDLRRFMACHVFSVWDFMSLVKYLQRELAPSEFPWQPRGNPATRRLINSLVLEEESDEDIPNAAGKITAYTSHFELYCRTMREIGASPEPVLRFVRRAMQEGIDKALTSEFIPPPAQRFTRTTFEFIQNNKPHQVAAALALGREHVIPTMFRTFLSKMAISETLAPSFHYYLKRHIHLDEDFHGPLSWQLLNELCAGDDEKLHEAETAAQQAILARLRFWDEVLQIIENRQ